MRERWIARSTSSTTTRRNNTMRFATSIEPKELLDYNGDVQASLAVNGFRMAAEDRAQFQQLQSAQLRIDVVQTKSLMQDLLDPMAWTSLASLVPRQFRPVAADAEPELRSRRGFAEDEAGDSAGWIGTMGGQSLDGPQGVRAGRRTEDGFGCSGQVCADRRPAADRRGGVAGIQPAVWRV